MERKSDGFADTLAATQDTIEEPSTALTLIGGGGTAVGGSAIPSDRYRLGEVLGRGGMGEVLSARDQQIGRSVAIKRLRGEATETAVARFLREAKIQGRLDHPAIVPVHELCRDEGGHPYFVMKQLTGTTLADVIASRDVEVQRKFDRQSLLRAFVDVCLAVEFAHTRGIVHRDLKPANIQLGDFGEVYVLDWGIARMIGEAAESPSLAEVEVPDAMTVAGAVLGTPGYMSPEQIRGETDLDGRADVYALGCILFELLSGSHLYQRGTAGLTDALRGTDARPSQRAPDREIPPELDRACVNATMADRAERIAKARELGDIVRRFLDGDRDLETRRALAREELQRARAALDRGTTADRREAMQAAARALALDPHAPEPAQLVGKLMIEPPVETPPEVELQLVADQRALLFAQTRTVLPAMALYSLMFPIAYFTGVAAAWLVIAGPLLLACVVAIASYGAKQANQRPFYLANFLIHCVIIAMISQAMTPFLVAPALIVVLVMLFSAQPRLANPIVIIGGGIVAVLGPFVLELAGVLPSTIHFTRSSMVLEPSGANVNATASLVALSGFVVLTVAASTLLSRAQTTQRDALLGKLQLQSWQLRQLVPQGSIAAVSRAEI